jgi:hypothetical protein
MCGYLQWFVIDLHGPFHVLGSGPAGKGISLSHMGMSTRVREPIFEGSKVWGEQAHLCWHCAPARDSKYASLRLLWFFW